MEDACSSRACCSRINSVGTHATARAFRARELGHWEPRDGDPIEFVRDAGERGEDAMTWFGAGLLLLVAISGLAVVRTRDVTEQVIALGFYGVLMALVFFYFQAPDVALSQITVGAVALPLMVMLAISRMKFRASATPQQSRSASGDDHD